MAPGSNAQIDVLMQDVATAKAAYDRANAAFRAEETDVARNNAEIEARGEGAGTSGPELGRLRDELTTAAGNLRAAERALAAAQSAGPTPPKPLSDLYSGVRDGTNADVPTPTGPRDPNLDTGHYDDGHSFGWKSAPPPSPADVMALDGKIDDAK